MNYKLGKKKDVVKRQKKQLEEIRTKSFEKNKEKQKNYKESIDNF